MTGEGFTDPRLGSRIVVEIGTDRVAAVAAAVGLGGAVPSADVDATDTGTGAVLEPTGLDVEFEDRGRFVDAARVVDTPVTDPSRPDVVAGAAHPPNVNSTTAATPARKMNSGRVDLASAFTQEGRMSRAPRLHQLKSITGTCAPATPARRRKQT